MRKILLIDNGSSSVRSFSRTLMRSNIKVIPAEHLKKVKKHLTHDSIDLIALESSLLPSVRKMAGLKRRFSSIPKIVLTHKDNFRAASALLNDRFSVLVHEPTSHRVFKYWMSNLLEKRSMEDDYRRLKDSHMMQSSIINFFTDAIHIFSDTTELHKILYSIMERIQVITGARTWSLLFNDEPFCDIVQFRTSRQIRKFRFQKGIGISGWILEHGFPLIINDVAKDKRFDKDADRCAGADIRSLMCAPLKIKERVVGVLRLINRKKEGSFNEYDLNVLAVAAGYCAIAVERAFLYEEIKTDDLTNLYNYRYLQQVLNMEVERAVRYGSLFSLIFMDLDNFKKVNDKYGHLIGSRILIEISRILHRNVRKIDVITRYGGDEFVIILPQTPHDSCLFVAERLRQVIAKHVFLKSEGYAIRLTASFGVASFPGNAKTKEDLLLLADKAMYRGKFTTKNIVFAAR